MVVMDIGSHYFKAGFAWNFPWMRSPGSCGSTASRCCPNPQVVGGVVRPVVDRGEIVELESITHHSLHDALSGPMGGEGGNVVPSEAMLTSRAEQEKLTQLMFEVRG